MNRTNLTPEPIHNSHKLPTPLVNGLAKRLRPANDGSARLKRLKFNIGESRLSEDEVEDSVDSDKSDEDGSIPFCIARRKRTIFHAKSALAMSRPGVTCRPLPCKSCFCLGIGLSLTTTVPTHSLLRAYVSSHKTDVFTCYSDRADSFLTPPYACAYTNGISFL